MDWDSVPPVFFQPLLSLHFCPDGVKHSSIALQDRSARHFAAHRILDIVNSDIVPLLFSYGMYPSSENKPDTGEDTALSEVAIRKSTVLAENRNLELNIFSA